jgi:hypothetical protein
LLRDPDHAAQIAGGHALLGLLQHGGDLPDGKAHPHGTPPGLSGLIVPQTLDPDGPRNPERLWVSSSPLRGDWQLDEIAAMRDPTHMVQIGGDRDVTIGEREGRTTLQRRVAA